MTYPAFFDFCDKICIILADTLDTVKINRRDYILKNGQQGELPTI